MLADYQAKGRALGTRNFTRFVALGVRVFTINDSTPRQIAARKLTEENGGAPIRPPTLPTYTIRETLAPTIIIVWELFSWRIPAQRDEKKPPSF